jgi:hypothetical protein
VPALFYSVRCIYDQAHQAVQRASGNQDTLFDLFDRIENCFRRLEAYLQIPPAAGMTDVIVKVMTEALLILALVTKEIEQGKISELVPDDRAFLSTHSSPGRFFKKLIRRSDIENASRRLDKLTQEEHRMATAQDLSATNHVLEGTHHLLTSVSHPYPLTDLKLELRRVVTERNRE